MEELVRATALGRGAEFFGIADLTVAREFISEQGGDEIARFPRAISVGLGMVDAIVDRLSHPLDRETAADYRNLCFDELNGQLFLIASELAGLLRDAGHEAMPVPCTRLGDKKARAGIMFSHKIAAHLAGLGWIGRNCLLVTPSRGPRVRWASVLTNARLKPTGTQTQSRCGECTECVAACPTGAITGRPFHPSEGRDARLQVARCRMQMRQANHRVGARVCGLCVKACPHGRSITH